MKKTISFLLLMVFMCACFAYSSADKKTGKSKEYGLTVEAYAYCYTTTRTACGTYPAYGTIAVDPKVIPLGSKIYVPGYGWGTALDTGASIKGNKIDIWFPTEKQCYSWGVRSVKIKVVRK